MVEPYITFEDFWEVTKGKKKKWPGVKLCHKDKSESDYIAYVEVKSIRGKEPNEREYHSQEWRLSVPEIDECYYIVRKGRIYCYLNYTIDGHDYVVMDESYEEMRKRFIRDHIVNGKKGNVDTLYQVLYCYFKVVFGLAQKNKRYLAQYGWGVESSYMEEENVVEYNMSVIHTPERILFCMAKEDKLSAKEMENFLKRLSSKHISLQLIFFYGLLSISDNVNNQDYENILYSHNGKYEEEQRRFRAESDNCDDFIEQDMYRSYWRLPTPSLCICGDNAAVSRIEIASDYLNYTKQNTSSPNGTCSHRPHFCIPFSDIDIQKSIVKYSDIPVIIRHTGNIESISPSTGGITDITALRRTGVLHVFPVYISKNAIKREGFLNVDISEIEITREEAREDAVIVETILVQYIEYIQKIINSMIPPHSFDDYYKAGKEYLKIHNTYVKFFSDDRYDIEKAVCNRGLVIAAERFKLYIQSQYPESYDTVTKMVKRIIAWLKNDTLYCEEKDTRTEKEKILDKVDAMIILESIMKEIKRSEKKEDTKQWQDQKEKGYCKVSYDLLSKVYKKHGKKGVSFQEFLRICRDRNLIIVRLDKQTGRFKQYYFETNVKGVKMKHIRVKETLDMLKVPVGKAK